VAARDEALAFTPEEVRRRGPARATLRGRPISIEWDPGRRTVRAWTLPPEKRRELAVVPMYWFALVRHFTVVRTFPAPERTRGK